MSVYCTIVAAHPLRHHFLHSVRGIAASGRDYRVVTPWRMSPGLYEIMTRLFWRRRSTLLHYTYPGVDSGRFYRLRFESSLVFARMISAERMCRLFDEVCASEFRAGRLRCDYLHIMQDYMPRTALEAHRVGAMIISEQILNASLEVRAVAAEIGRKWKVGLSDFGLAKSEDNNDAILQRATAAVCPSEFVIKGLRGRFAGRIAHIPYGVDLSAFRPMAKVDPSQEFRLVVRATTLRKGLPLAIAGLSLLINDVRFRKTPVRMQVNFLGELQSYAGLAQELESLGTHPWISLSVGNRSRRETARLLGEAHAFLLPSISEGMSYAVLEAAACGAVPIISANCGQDGFHDGEHGLVLPELTAEAISSALWKLLADRESLKKLAHATIGYAASKSWNNFESEIAQLYRTLDMNR